MWVCMSATCNKQRDAFSSCHPFVNFYYFTLVIVCAMFFLHPVFMGISFVSAVIYSIYLNGKKAVKFTLLGIVPMFLAATIFNPLFSHAGVTILFFHPNGNPITLESILYGVAMGGMLVSVIAWFSCFNAVMTSDKFTYLFGKIIPALSLVFSMTLRLVPRFKAQIKVIAKAQKCIGKGAMSGNVFKRIRNGIAIISILVTWALENAIETAHSMKSRGYGLKGRTQFSIFRFEKRDVLMLCLLVFATIILLIGTVLSLTTIQFFPWIIIAPMTPFSVFMYVIFIMLVSIPMILNILEDMKWKSIKSKM